MSRCDRSAAEAGSRPGGRVPFLCRQERNQRSGPRFNAPCCARGSQRCSNHRVAAQLALATLGARTVLATATLRVSEPDASALLGVSEGVGKASMFNRCASPRCANERLAMTPDSAALHPGCECAMHGETSMVLTLGPVESAEWRSGGGGSARSADGEDCLRPAGPSSAAARLREHAREVRCAAPDREGRVVFSWLLLLTKQKK